MAIIELKAPIIILVEGKNFLYVLGHLLEAYEWHKQVQLIDFSNAKNSTPHKMLQSIRVPREFSEVKVVGVIRDCEECRSKMQLQVSKAFKDNGFAEPEHESVVSIGMPKTTYLLVPTSESGCIESAMRSAIIDNNHESCALKFISCMQKTGNANWEDKAIVRSLISVSDKPDATLGQSVYSGVWDRTHIEIRRITEWINRLLLYT